MMWNSASPLPPGCPWSEFQRPTLSFCEENLCAWITAPANTWSNLGFVIWGIWIWQDAIKKSKPGSFLRWVGPILILIGLLSGFYHGSYTWIGQVGDLSSMYLMASLFVTLNLRRLNWINGIQAVPFYILLNAFAIALLIRFQKIGIIEFAVIALFGLALEFGILRKKKPKPEYRNLMVACGIWAFAQTVWVLDITHVWCEPSRHWFQWHAVWHLGTATSAAFVYLFYRQFANGNKV